MKIAYRRMSGAIGVSELEKGSRGLWWEKRKAFVKLLRSRGHKVEYVNRMTKFSERGPILPLTPDHDLLIIEFGSSNTAFYKDDLEETARMITRHDGKIIFICDDPDLPYRWETVMNKDYSRWSAWYNCLAPFATPHHPNGMLAFDFPFSSFQEFHRPRNEYGQHLVYIGRPTGRDAYVQQFIKNKVPWKVYSNPKDWKEYIRTGKLEIHNPPDQPMRLDFYQRQLGCLALADTKHRRLGWRTGRAYHAVLAGCPALIHKSHELKGFDHFETPQEVIEYAKYWMDPVSRCYSWEHSMHAILEEISIGLKTLEAHNL